MKPHPNHNGYLIQPFFVNGKMIARSMHQLVARQFIPNPKNKRTVNHINGNKSDNRVENLEWATDSEQMQHASKVLKVLESSRKIPIVGISLYNDDVVFFPSILAAAIHFGVRRQKIHNVIQGRRKSSCGYVWMKDRSPREEVVKELQIEKEKILMKRKKIRRVGM